jgi:hypothetical protein
MLIYTCDFCNDERDRAEISSLIAMNEGAFGEFLRTKVPQEPVLRAHICNPCLARLKQIIEGKKWSEEVLVRYELNLERP